MQNENLYVGYVTLYVKVSLDNGETAYAKYESDFGDPTSLGKFMKEFLDMTKKVYEFQSKCKVTYCGYVCKAEYEDNKDDSCGLNCTITFDED